MMMSEIWIAFERRSKFGDTGQAWTPERRARNLLRLDVEQPLSVDVDVWPRAAAGALVGISVFPVHEEDSYRWQQLSIDSSLRAELLGYDVADGSLLSGLSNCGYTSEERDMMREQFINDINESHLLSSLQRARDFVKVTNTRVPEHSPFYVFGTYSLKAIASGA